MNKIVVDNVSNRVMHIINLDTDDRFNPDWYPNCYIIDDVDNKINSYGLVYNKDLEVFEVLEGYEEEVSEVLPSDTKILEAQLKKKDKEILALKRAAAEIVEANENEDFSLKLAMAEMSEEKDSEILKLKLAIAELVEGGI